MRIKKFNKKHIKTLRELGVEIIYLFGSQAEGRPGPLSDVDIGVVFSEPEKYRNNTMDAYNKIYDIFQDVLPKSYLRKRFKLRGHEYDIVFLQFAPVSLQFAAITKNKILYQKNDKKRFNYQETVLKSYLDFRHYLNIFQDATLARI